MYHRADILFRNGWIFFELGKKYSNPNNPSYSIDDAIYLLLMAFYLDKAFLPSPCWMVTGSMARVCQDIGLYRRAPAGMFSGIDVESRTRLFWAAYIQDRKISMKQGRPVIFLDRHIDVGLPGGHVGTGVGSGGGEDLEAAKKSLQVFRATIGVAQTSESLLNINLRHDGEAEDVQLLRSVDEMLKRSWEAYPPDLTDLSESGPIDLPALRPLFHLQHSRIVLYRYFTDFSETLSLTNNFRTFCLCQSIQVSKITAHLLLRASKDPDFDVAFGLGSEELVRIHTFRVATILLLGYYCKDRNLPGVSKEEVDICASALTSVAKTNRQAGEKLLGLFKDFALMFGYSVAPSLASGSALTAVKEGSEVSPPAASSWCSEPSQNTLQPSSSLPLPRFGGGFNVYPSTPPEASAQEASASEFPTHAPPSSGAAHPHWLHATTGAILLPVAGSGGGASGESSGGIFIHPEIGTGSAAAGAAGALAGSSLGAEGRIDWGAYQQMMQFDPGFAAYMLGPNDRDFH
ncbi:unnamed protein product [Tuber melanosporum]|uniref:(Perigord truffle) hypothetical protein n=1 Tax=Tuber melanosporum (strain Mel28) TaxID=656061 RepID=D5GJV9_TUBMM|nr:uncharacterized protein GSTUM_00009229001 [Tuber melanosporum]CAZ84802.1 unnamed protein product [Tuber melanosporum]